MKKYAKDHNTSLSKIVNLFFKSVLDKSAPNSQTPEKTEKLQGVLKNLDLDESDYKKHLEDKYL